MSGRRLRKGLGVVALAALAAGCPLPPSERPCEGPPGPAPTVGEAGHALRFCGTGRDDVDRVKIVIDDPRTGEPGPAVDIGATDFTLEWWMKAALADNPSEAVTCGENLNWINGNIIFDRDRYGQGRKLGVSMAGGHIVFGVTDATDRHLTICSTTSVADGAWHHVSVQRRRADGRMSLFVDGRLEAREIGPPGDVSYPDDGVPMDFCGGLCLNSDPYLVIGAEKHDAGIVFPSYRGWLDEVRVSTTLRYEDDFARPTGPFTPDEATAALWHFDDGAGHVLTDSSGRGAHGLVHIGGLHGAPHWEVSDAPLGSRP